MSVADHQLVTAGTLSVSLFTRFDRQDSRRIPFLSAAPLLGLPQDQGSAYTMIADASHNDGDDVTRDLHELWRRMVFGLLASNCDDHSRKPGAMSAGNCASRRPHFPPTPAPSSTRFWMRPGRCCGDLKKDHIPALRSFFVQDSPDSAFHARAPPSSIGSYNFRFCHCSGWCGVF